ncbi:hypothetical protein RUM43_005588 [Polyplax serrata]|uniref:Uncharacterized protein n=1 Tax=Polyplax serrata TaxID=468196 RepID=A0AAN8NWZ6_POLSC
MTWNNEKDLIDRKGGEEMAMCTAGSVAARSAHERDSRLNSSESIPGKGGNQIGTHSSTGRDKTPSPLRIRIKNELQNNKHVEDDSEKVKIWKNRIETSSSDLARRSKTNRAEKDVKGKSKENLNGQDETV